DRIPGIDAPHSTVRAYSGFSEEAGYLREILSCRIEVENCVIRPERPNILSEADCDLREEVLGVEWTPGLHGQAVPIQFPGRIDTPGISIDTCSNLRERRARNRMEG